MIAEIVTEGFGSFGSIADVTLEGFASAAASSATPTSLVRVRYRRRPAPTVLVPERSSRLRFSSRSTTITFSH